MSRNVNRKLLIILVGILSLFINTSGVKALTCEYVMYPVSYYYPVGGSAIPKPIDMSRNPTVNVKVTYTSGNKASLEVSGSMLAKEKYDKNIKGIVKQMKKGTCPEYAKLSNSNVKEITQKEAYDETDSMVSKGVVESKEIWIPNPVMVMQKLYLPVFSGKVKSNHPIALIKTDGKSTPKPAAILSNYAINKWISIASSAKSDYGSCPSEATMKSTMGYSNFNSFYEHATSKYDANNLTAAEQSLEGFTEECWGKRAEYLHAVKSGIVFYDAIAADKEVFDQIKKMNGAFDIFADFIIYSREGETTIKRREELNETNNKISEIESDYCSLYCPRTQCGSYSGNSTVFSECKKTCEANAKPKCDSAYDSCKNDSNVDACMKTSLANNGLDANYVETRTEELNKLKEDAEKLTQKVYSSRVKGLDIDLEDYKLTCKDVENLHKYWVAFVIISPILVILYGSADFLMSIMSSNEEKIIKARKNFPKRLLAAVLILMAAFIVSVIVGVSTNGNVKDISLLRCIVNGK